LQRAGRPLARIELKSPEYIGQEFFRFELAIAVAGAVIGINPFDQPDVEASKAKTRELTAAFKKTGALPGETPGIESASFRERRMLRNRDARFQSARRDRDHAQCATCCLLSTAST
jgi:hypothetical protein